MFLNRFLKVVLLLLGGLYIVLQGFAFEDKGAGVSALTLILLTVLYCRWTKNKSKLFFWFLLTFTSAQILACLSHYMPAIEEGKIDYYYYGANALYILSYLLLITRVALQLNFKVVLSQLAIPVVILLILDVFCVSLVTATTESVLSIPQYTLEYTYNAVIMALLSIALIDYMYRNDNKSMLFLIGSICIVFSEIIQLAYFYILPDNNLGFVYSFFLVVAFIFFYVQSQMEYTGPEQPFFDEHLEA